MIVYKAEPQYIDVLWPHVGPLLSKAIERTIGEISLEDVKEWLKEQRQQLWVIVDEEEREVIGAFTTEIYIYPKNALNLWERIFYDVAKDYPEIDTDYGHVDAVCMWMVKNPEWFDVIVTDNMFGDIITDLGAMIQGGMGIAAGGNINPEGVSMFEPIGGSAPKYTNKNVINPLACIGAAAMMVKQLGEGNYAEDIEKAIIETAIKLDSLSAGKMGMSTS